MLSYNSNPKFKIKLKIKIKTKSTVFNFDKPNIWKSKYYVILLVILWVVFVYSLQSKWESYPWLYIVEGVCCKLHSTCIFTTSGLVLTNQVILESPV